MGSVALNDRREGEETGCPERAAQHVTGGLDAGLCLPGGSNSALQPLLDRIHRRNPSPG
jgi:hypothetical protein